MWSSAFSYEDGYNVSGYGPFHFKAEYGNYIFAKVHLNQQPEDPEYGQFKDASLDPDNIDHIALY